MARHRPRNSLRLSACGLASIFWMSSNTPLPSAHKPQAALRCWQTSSGRRPAASSRGNSTRWRSRRRRRLRRRRRWRHQPRPHPLAAAGGAEAREGVRARQRRRPGRPRAVPLARPATSMPRSRPRRRARLRPHLTGGLLPCTIPYWVNGFAPTDTGPNVPLIARLAKGVSVSGDLHD